MILVAVAGGLGAACRLLIDGLVSSRSSDRFPWGTRLINVAGAFLLGLLVTLDDPRGEAVIGTGFLAGFTTFSTASFETARLAIDRRPGAATVYGLGVFGLAVAAASTGYVLGQL